MSQLIPDDVGLFLRWLLAFGMLSARYLVFAGAAYLLYYVIKRQDWLFMKIQQQFPKRKQVLTEITYSFLSFVIFALMIVGMRVISQHGILETKIYRHFSEHSALYYVLSTVFIIFFHDTYFYWIHRLMHQPFLYERIHKVHHLSKDPTPWAAFAFHPAEAFLEFAFIPIIIFTLPLHYTSLIILGLWQVIFNVMGHLGYELFPRKMVQHPFFKWLNTSTNHNMHHKFVRCNYGLYFNIWDRILNTNHNKYYETYDEVTARRDEGFKRMKLKEPATGNIA